MVLRPNNEKDYDTMTVHCGVDEAGRGPLIGPIVMAAVCAEEKDIPAGTRDSKLIAPAVRERLYEQIKMLPHAIIAVQPAQIDERVYQNELNFLEADTTVKLLKQLEQHMSLPKAIVDCPSTNVQAYKEYLQERLPNWELVVEHKADANHKVAAAASILAKVERDRAIESLKAEVGDFGSGYPADPKTQVFIKTVDLQWPQLRKSWSTWEKEKARRSQKTLF